MISLKMCLLYFYWQFLSRGYTFLTSHLTFYHSSPIFVLFRLHRHPLRIFLRSFPLYLCLLLVFLTRLSPRSSASSSCSSASSCLSSASSFRFSALPPPSVLLHSSRSSALLPREFSSIAPRRPHSHEPGSLAVEDIYGFKVFWAFQKFVSTSSFIAC